MRPTARPVLLPLVVLPLLAACVVERVVSPADGDGAASDTTFTWARPLAAGAQLSVADGSGDVEVRPADGDRAEVVATVTVADRGRPASSVAFGVEQTAAGYAICTLYDGAARCGERMQPVNARVHLAVLLPRGVRLVATTGIGAIDVAGATAAVVATSGIGRIRIVDASATVVASTGNGEIELRRAGGSDADATLSSGIGAITAALPAEFRGRVEATTGIGVVRSDFPVTITGVADARRLSGTIGGGGAATIRMTTGNGAVTLRRR